MEQEEKIIIEVDTSSLYTPMNILYFLGVIAAEVFLANKVNWEGLGSYQGAAFILMLILDITLVSCLLLYLIAEDKEMTVEVLLAAGYKQTLQSLDKTFSEFQAKTQREKSEMQATHAKVVSELKATLSEYMKNYSEFKKGMSERNKTFSEMEQSISEYKATVRGLKETLSEKENELATAKEWQATVSEDLAKLSQLENSLSESQRRVSELGIQVSDWKSKAKSLQNSNNALKRNKTTV